MFIVDVKVVLSFIEDPQTLKIIQLKLYVDQELFQEVWSRVIFAWFDGTAHRLHEISKVNLVKFEVIYLGLEGLDV